MANAASTQQKESTVKAAASEVQFTNHASAMQCVIDILELTGGTSDRQDKGVQCGVKPTCRSLAVSFWLHRSSRPPGRGGRGCSRGRGRLCRAGRRLVSTKVLVVHRLPLVTAQSAAGCHIAGLHVILAPEHGLDLKLEIELEVVQGIDFSC